MLSSSGGHGAALAALHSACASHLSEFFENVDGLSNVLTLEGDLTTWLNVLAERPESRQYQSAHRDLGLSLYSLSTGVYRQGFAGLRSFIEVSFGALHLSSAEFERRRWVSGRRDLSWAEITDINSGLFSVNYVREFQPNALGEASSMRESLRESYRRCSEYLHGNVQTSALVPDSIKYSTEIVEEWILTASAALKALHFSFFVRYHGDMTQSERDAIEPILEQHFSTLKSVRAALGLPIEGTV